MPVIAKTLEAAASLRKEIAQDEDTQDAKVPLMCNNDSLVQYLSNDPCAVDAERLDGQPITGELQARCVLPCEFAVNLTDKYEPGTMFTVQGPVGPIQVEPPLDSKPGMTLRYRLAPKPDFRVQVPPGGKPGSTVNFQRSDGVDISVVVPNEYEPGDYFDVTPPALMVEVPEGVEKGDFVSFRGPRAAGLPAEWFRAQIPDSVKPGKFMTARLPMPPLQRSSPPLRQGWSSLWKARTKPTMQDEASYAPLQILSPVQGPVQVFDRDPFAVNAESVDGESMGGELWAQATLPVELQATIGENYEPGTSLAVQTPIGYIRIEPPADVKPGTTMCYRLAPKPDMKVQVPPGGKPGSVLIVKRPDGVEVNVTVPEGIGPGDVFEVTPPVLMVRVPDGAETGDFVVFNSPIAPNQPIMRFRAQVPAGLIPGMIFTARLPKPRLPPKDGNPRCRWSWRSAWKGIIEGGA